MRIATYIGRRHYHLQGKTALVRRKGRRHLLAQFDDTSLPQAFGWHKFQRKEFKVVQCDHEWKYDGGDWSVGIPGGWVCINCGLTDINREPPSFEDDVI